MTIRHTRQMSDKHEAWLADLFGGDLMPGSGNQFNRPMDVRQSRYEVHNAICIDGKSTRGNSVGVTPAMWRKAQEQAHGEQPVLALRWYTTDRLDVGLDLVAIDPLFLAELLDDSRELHGLKAGED